MSNNTHATYKAATQSHNYRACGIHCCHSNPKRAKQHCVPADPPSSPVLCAHVMTMHVIKSPREMAREKSAPGTQQRSCSSVDNNTQMAAAGRKRVSIVHSACVAQHMPSTVWRTVSTCVLPNIAAASAASAAVLTCWLYSQSCGMKARSMATLTQPATSSVMLLCDSLRTTPPAGQKEGGCTQFYRQTATLTKQ